MIRPRLAHDRERKRGHAIYTMVRVVHDESGHQYPRHRICDDQPVIDTTAVKTT
jgi:hypothetical protein